MKRVFKSWNSPSMGKEMDLLIYGDEGTPVIVFPSAHANFNEGEDKHAVHILQQQIDDGFNQLFLIDNFSDESFLNHEIEPLSRIRRFEQYQEYIMDELLPFISDINSNPFIITTGVAIGAYAALLMALKYPTNFQKVVGICGYFDIRVHMNNVIDDSIYYNNPVEFIPNLNDDNLLKLISSVDIRLLNYKNDPTKDETRKMSDLLWLKFIEHEHYVWDQESNDLWTLAPHMLKDNLF
jgi:esterase/lipase superfamily enzyme